MLKTGRHADAIQPGRLPVGDGSRLGLDLKSTSFGPTCLSRSSGGSTTLPRTALKSYGDCDDTASLFTLAAGWHGLIGLAESLPCLLELLAERGPTLRGCFSLGLPGLTPPGGFSRSLTEVYKDGGSCASPLLGKGGP
ncbi:hypothetical protein ES703_69542 [subsurface metagenome]